MHKQWLSVFCVCRLPVFFDEQIKCKMATNHKSHPSIVRRLHKQQRTLEIIKKVRTTHTHRYRSIGNYALLPLLKLLLQTAVQLRVIYSVSFSDTRTKCLPEFYMWNHIIRSRLWAEEAQRQAGCLCNRPMGEISCFEKRERVCSTLLSITAPTFIISPWTKGWLSCGALSYVRVSYVWEVRYCLLCTKYLVPGIMYQVSLHVNQSILRNSRRERSYSV